MANRINSSFRGGLAAILLGATALVTCPQRADAGEAKAFWDLMKLGTKDPQLEKSCDFFGSAFDSWNEDEEKREAEKKAAKEHGEVMDALENKSSGKSGTTPIFVYTTKDEITSTSGTWGDLTFMVLQKDNSVLWNERGIVPEKNGWKEYTYGPGKLAPGEYTFQWYQERTSGKYLLKEEKIRVVGNGENETNVRKSNNLEAKTEPVREFKKNPDYEIKQSYNYTTNDTISSSVIVPNDNARIMFGAVGANHKIVKTDNGELTIERGMRKYTKTFKPGELPEGSYTFEWFSEYYPVRLDRVTITSDKPAEVNANNLEEKTQPVSEALNKEPLEQRENKTDKIQSYAEFLSSEDEIIGMTGNRASAVMKNKSVGIYILRKKIMLDSKVDENDKVIKETKINTLYKNDAYGYYYVPQGFK